ncbi:hypothetical protein LX32DRAFT_550952 [Colletotrichum zoysiae]|uniref:Zn(2)-C6 fungal-type domain-containing protein n=1 Tax=Colletotrichum zoysiae TaxID=1216348 RepID=A0AAD9HW94_9PEZI|nr:hypothetical protein LX32DRAFT_550952 [Colletotrichum zoysiae]
MTNRAPLVAKFALAQRPRFVRASKPKVRTGCITCRRRRVKCDEGKPACSVCLKYQGRCEGYESKKPRDLGFSSQRRAIYPILEWREAEDVFLIEPDFTSRMFSNQLEKDHFDYWLAFTGSTLLFRSELLTKVIPQISWQDPAIKHAALAIGALALSGTTRTERMLGKGRFNSDALMHYGKAMNLLYSSAMSPERTLLACLLFITFESLRGNKIAGLSHINHGSLILDQHSPHGVDPNPFMDEVMASFQHFGLQSWSHGGAHPKETDTRVPWCCRGRKAKYAIQEMPSVFGSLEDSPTWPLGSAFLMCPASEVKDEIIRLFKEYPRRDGLWDTHGFLVIIEWLKEMSTAGYALDAGSHIVECNVVFREHSVKVVKRLWNPAKSKWKHNGISFSIL